MRKWICKIICNSIIKAQEEEIKKMRKKITGLLYLIHAQKIRIKRLLEKVEEDEEPSSTRTRIECLEGLDG